MLKQRLHFDYSSHLTQATNTKSQKIILDGIIFRTHKIIFKKSPRHREIHKRRSETKIVLKIPRRNLLENYLFEHGSNPSLRKAIEQPNSKATNRRASQPTNPLFNVATIINHLGYLYFCISLWDSRHIQAIGAKFSSLSIYIRDDGSITRLARLVFILYPGWHPARHPFSPQRAACTWIFTNFERKRGGRQHHRPSPPRAVSRASQPSFSRPFSTRSTPSIRENERNCSSYANLCGATGFLFQRK